MKKILYTIMALAMSAFALQSCEDVPEPYDIPGQETGTDTPDVPVIEPVGDGTVANPYNVTAALQIIKALDATGKTEPMYVKGIISSIRQVETAQYGNANYYISDDGSSANKDNQLYIFQSLYLGNVKFTSENQIKEGDEVVIYGSFVNYQGNTPETEGKGTSYIYSLNGQTSGGDKPTTGEAKGDGTLENPYNSVAANQYASSLAAGAESDHDVYIKGKIVSIKENYTTQYGNAAFYISDDGTSKDQFYVFRTLYLNNVAYTEGDLLSVGDEVVICGKVTNYMGNTPETAMNKSYLYSWTKGEGGNTGGDTGDTSAPNGDFEAWAGGQPVNWSTASTAGNATLSQSDDAHGGKYSVKVGGTNAANKRLGYKEMELKAGEYTMTFYVKAATAAGASVRPGYVQVTDGKVGSYMYGDYVNDLKNNEWVLVTHTFTLAADGTYCIVIMNSKNPGADVLIDDFTLSVDGNVIIK